MEEKKIKEQAVAVYNKVKSEQLRNFKTRMPENKQGVEFSQGG